MNGDARQFVARMRSTLILLAAALLPPASADAMDRPFRVPAATFQEIFGLSESDASKLFDGDLMGCLRSAHEDFNAAASGRDPPHSELVTLAADGGTSNWRGKCYDLTILRHGVEFRSGKKCYIGYVFGPSLFIRDRIDWDAPISRTQLVGVSSEPCR